ncbi:hypothetical protein F511_39395 [Dorcoceras hygrometricum]|uniref:Uncharacterized protein n=1 Tax=Dorcoceras hygrometricum TaxID=472368 RepID=A0A2Z7A7P6_9LAMI|nr:hypothetical protein F511_39395 [Dorcoceras hygrometricum]
MVISAAASIDSVSPRPEVQEPWLPEPEELPNTPWYEEKSSNLNLPHPDERAHRPPPGFHSFYMNQIEMSLWFPIPRFIAALCHHIKISPSQLAPNSYSFLLALAVLLCYHDLPLIPYVLMQIIQIKRLGPGKFYISHKGDHTFIKGNPSSHKGWMSRFFYIKCDRMRDPWRCEMHWRDNVFTLTPRTPDRAPSLTPFLEAMRGDRIGRAELLRAMKEEARASREVGSPKKATKKRKAPSSADTEVPRERRKKSVSTSGTLPEETQERSRAPTPPTATPEEIPDPTPVICNMAPEPDLQVLAQADDAEVIGHFSTHIAPAIAWWGEMVKRLTRAHQKVDATRKNFDKAMNQHAEAVARLEELEAHRSRELEAAKIQRESLEAELAAEKEARAAERDALKAWGYFKDGFWGCLARFRANCYPEEDHPASFLDLQQALADVRDKEEVEEEEEGEGKSYVKFSSAEIGLVAEQVGLMCLRRRATRSLPVQNWALLLSSGRHPRSLIIETMN